MKTTRLLACTLFFVLLMNQASAAFIFTTDNPYIGPPVGQLVGRPLCFQDTQGGEHCDYSGPFFSIGSDLLNPPMVLSAPAGGSGELMFLEDTISAFEIGHRFTTYSLGNNLRGRFRAQSRLNGSATYSTLDFAIGSDHLFPIQEPLTSGGAFEAIEGVNYYAVVVGYATEPVDYSFRIFAVPEPATTALLLIGVCALGTKRRTKLSRR